MSDPLTEATEEIVNIAVRNTLDAVAEAFEECAREDIDGESATITYRSIIRILRNAGPQTPEPQSLRA
jgi:hypothetical protein